MVAVLACLGMTASAGTIVFGDLNLENGKQYLEPFDGGDFTVTFSGGGNDGKYYTTGAGIRVYGGGKMTIAAKEGNITSIKLEYDGTNKPTTDDIVDVGTYISGSDLWTGNNEQVVFTRPTGSGHWRVKSIEVTIGGEVIDPSQLAKTLYSEAFSTQQNQGKFTIDNKFMHDSLSHVWTFNNYGAVASAFLNNTAYDSESWLVSPTIDLANATEVTLEFGHAVNKFASIDDAKTKCVVMVKIDNGNWVPLNGVTYPEILGWSFIDNKIDLSTIADGKKLQVAFKYTSDDESAGTWEINGVTIKGKGEATIEAEEVPPTPVASVADLVQLTANTANIELTLAGAQVVLNDGNNIYVREGNAAFCLYKIGDPLSKSLVNNAKVDGKLRGDFEWYNKMPEFKSNGYTDAATLNVVAVETEEEHAKPVATTLAEVGQHVCDLVTLKASLSRDTTGGSTTYYLEQENTKLVVVNNGKNLKALCDSDVVDVTVIGVVTTTKDGYQLKLTKNAIDNEAANVRSIEATENKQATVVYNLAGQRVNALRKGLYIINGKKVVK